MTYEDVDCTNYEAIIIPGGDLYHVKDSDQLFKIVQEFDHQKKLIAAICSAGYVLGRAGLLNNNPYTVTLNEEQRAFLGLPEATYRYDKFVWSGHILTSQGHAFVDFGLQIASYFNFVTDAHIRFFKGESNLMMEDTK